VRDTVEVLEPILRIAGQTSSRQRSDSEPTQICHPLSCLLKVGRRSDRRSTRSAPHSLSSKRCQWGLVSTKWAMTIETCVEIVQDLCQDSFLRRTQTMFSIETIYTKLLTKVNLFQSSCTSTFSSAESRNFSRTTPMWVNLSIKRC
jgi:hypothetical protein